MRLSFLKIGEGLRGHPDVDGAMDARPDKKSFVWEEMQALPDSISLKGQLPLERPDISLVRESDHKLARRAASGERAAQHAIVDRHTNDLFRLALGLCASVADAEDVVQETLIAALKGIERFDGRASLLTWMSRILIRRAARLWRRSSARATLPIDGLADREGGVGWNEEPSVPESTDATDCRIDLMWALPRLAREYREVIVLRELQGMSYEQIATSLQIPQGTVDSRLYRARRELRQLLGVYRT